MSMKYTRIVSFGDSFTWGSDLQDADTSQLHPAGYSHSTWPALLAKHLNIDYASYSLGGCSNPSIARWVQSVLNFPKHEQLTSTDLVIVNWTWIDRWEYFDYDRKDWVYVNPYDSNTDAQTFYKNIHTEYGAKFDSLRSVDWTLRTLKDYNIDCFFTCLDPMLVNQDYLFGRGDMRTAFKSVTPAINWFDGKGFYDWAVDNGYPTGETDHPTELAHQQAFEYIRDNYDFTK